jgi:transposase-like protein
MESALCSVFLSAGMEKAPDWGLSDCWHCALCVFCEITMLSCARQEEDIPMETTLQPARPGWEHRLHAVLALLGGEPVPQVTARFGMGRSILYKWRRRALTALQGALTDHRPGSQCPANRLNSRSWSWPSAIRPGVRRRSTPRPAQTRRHPVPFNACAIAARCRASPNGRPPVGPPGASRAR